MRLAAKIQLALLLAACAQAAGAAQSVPGAQGALPGTGCQQPELPALSQARRNLERSETTLRDWFAVADAMLARSCNEAAVHLLEAAETRGESGTELQRRLREARSLVTEQRYIEGLGQAEEAARLQRLVLRCSRLGDLDACDDALKIAPANATALQGRNDAVQKVANSCLAGSGRAALADCDAALQHGAANASALGARRQSLLGEAGIAPSSAISTPSVARTPSASAVATPRVAASTPRPRRYSNEEPPTRTH